MLSSEKPQQLQMGGVLVVTDETQKERRVGENKKKSLLNLSFSTCIDFIS
jgi:hypothetical protein